MNMELEQLMKETVRKVSSKFFNPSIPRPILTDDVPNGSADIASGQVKINPRFILDLETEGVPRQESLDEVLSHEFTHITRFPGTAHKRMRQYAEARNLLETKDMAEAAVYAFNEAQTNLYVGVNLQHPGMPKVARVVAKGSKGLNKLLDGLYQEMVDQDLGVKLSRKEKKSLQQLKKIAFTDQHNEDDNLRKFIAEVKDYLKQYRPRQGAGFLGMFTDEQIQEGLASLAQECSGKGYTPEQFEQLVMELSTKGKLTPGAGAGQGKLREATDIYTALSRGYAVPIVRRQVKGSGAQIPAEHKPFTTETPLEDLDSFSSRGILPGVTQAWIRREGETTMQKSVPHAVEIIDNSPSMPDPNKSLSIPVLGANVIARAYLVNDRNVTVYSFGSSDYVYGPSRDEKEIGRVLRLHSGREGGTTFNPEKLQAILRERKEPFDLSIISDMEIANLGDFVKAIAGMPALHRVHVFYTNPQKIKYVQQIQAATQTMSNIGFAQLYTKEDIEKITLGELKKSLQ